jgi:hypothetical protein
MTVQCRSLAKHGFVSAVKIRWCEL